MVIRVEQEVNVIKEVDQKPRGSKSQRPLFLTSLIERTDFCGCGKCFDFHLLMQRLVCTHGVISLKAKILQLSHPFSFPV